MAAEQLRMRAAACAPSWLWESCMFNMAISRSRCASCWWLLPERCGGSTVFSMTSCVGARYSSVHSHAAASMNALLSGTPSTTRTSALHCCCSCLPRAPSKICSGCATSRSTLCVCAAHDRCDASKTSDVSSIKPMPPWRIGIDICSLAVCGTCALPTSMMRCTAPCTLPSSYAVASATCACSSVRCRWRNLCWTHLHPSSSWCCLGDAGKSMMVSTRAHALFAASAHCWLTQSRGVQMVLNRVKIGGSESQ